LIGIGEKGFLSVELVIETTGGHSSTPPRDTAIGVLSRAIARLEANPMPARLTEATEVAYELLAPELPFWKRVVVSNLWLFEPVALATLTAAPQTNANVRTTAAPTILEAGVKDNVLPSRARAVVNFRILPGDTVDGVLAHVSSAIADPRVQVCKVERGAGDPPPLAPVSGPVYESLEATIRQFYPTALVIPFVLNGATDGRHYAAIADVVYHFRPQQVSRDDIPRFHGTNERVPVADLGTVVRVYAQMMRAIE
jgi:carboxypeptidase PM20D1